jgi:hypothetical protein
VSEAQSQKINFRVLMANKMVERLSNAKVPVNTFPMLMAATTTTKAVADEEIRPMRDKFEDRETEIIH